MRIEAIQNISSISPLENGADSARTKPGKTAPQQDKPIPKGKHDKAEVSSSLLDRVQKNLKILHDVNFQFSVHKATGQIIVKIIDQETGKVIREVPPEQVLDLAARIEKMIGIFFNKKV